MSLPSPPISRSLPSPPVMVSLPAPPSTVSWISVARPLPAVKVSSPPLTLTTRFSLVPMSRKNGAGVTRSNRTRVPLAVTVNVSATLPPLTSTVSMPSPPSFRSLPSPGFQIIRSLPAWPNTWSSPVPPVRVSLPAPPNRRSSPPLPSRVSLPAWPKSRSFPDPPVSDVVAGAAEEVRLRQRAVGLVERDACRCRPGRRPGSGRCSRRSAVPPRTATAPPLTRSRAGRVAADVDGVVLGVAEDGAASAAVNMAITAGTSRASSGSSGGREPVRPQAGRHLRLCPRSPGAVEQGSIHCAQHN